MTVDDRDSFDPDPDYDTDQLSFGELHNYPWRTPYPYDGHQSPAPRRPELLGDLEDAWWADVTAWTDWLIATFRLSRWFPPCWLQHPALVEEAQALWLAWSASWLPGTDPHAPTHFLSSLAAALHRIDVLWQIPCRPDEHIDPTPVRGSFRSRPATAEWWSLPEFDPAAPAW